MQGGLVPRMESFIYNETMRPRATLNRFDQFLISQGVTLAAVVVGGTALELLGIITRETRDCDVIHPSLPADVLEAARAFAIIETANGRVLAEDWLNNGPSKVGPLLPAGWEARTQPAFDGVAVQLRVLGRRDLLLTKLFALCDRGTDLGDCVALAPSALELEELAPWVAKQDAHPQWPAHVEATLLDLARRLGHGI
jgi:hypothetical protein